MLHFTLKKELRHFTTEVTAHLEQETLVLIGHSGCGKSTMLKMLSGLLSPDDGEIKINDENLYNKNTNVPPEERNIGYVFQNYALFPHLTVRDNVAYGLTGLTRDEQDKRVNETLAFLEIKRLADSKPPLLSGGEQQRVALARALVTKPKVLLLDEPLSALDVSTRSRVRMELKELLKKLSIPTIIVTHDFEDARVLADKVAVMDQGIIIQSGTQEEIARYPASPFVAQFTGTNLLPAGEDSRTYVAFDPWKVSVTLEPENKQYQWQGKIRDINYNGGFIRMQIDFVENNSPFFADIPIDQFDQDNFIIGKTVYGNIEEEDARPIELSPSMAKKSGKKETEQQVEKQPARKKRVRWKLPALAAAVLLASVLSIFAFQSNSEGAAEKTEMLALVAANATAPFNELMEEFEKTHPNVDIEATYAGTQIVRTQLEQGANADLFLSADLGHIEAVQQQDLVNDFFPVSLNSVTIVVPKDNPLEVDSLEDLGTKDIKLVIGTDTVPIGIYSREVLNNANAKYGDNFSQQAMDHVVSFETNVKQVLQKVSLGEAEAGMVYPTDITPDFAKNVTEVEVPEEFNIVATNYISVPNKAPNTELAEEFMEMMLSDKGQEIFKKHGYSPVE